MKKQAFVILTTVSLLVLLTATSVNAQADMRLKVTIPLEFSVGGKTLPAGKYTVRYRSEGYLLIQSADRRASQSFFTLPAGAGIKQNESSLIFNRYGNQYFLSTIWKTGAGLAVRKSRAEEQLIRGRQELAGASQRQTVSVVADR